MPDLLKSADAESRAANDVTVRVVTEPARRPRRWTFGSVVALLMAGVVGVVMLGVVGVLTGVLHLPNPFSTSTVDRSTPALLNKVSDLSQYSAARAHFQQTVDVEDDVAFLPTFVAGERTTFLANGTVDATVDFSKLPKGAVQVDGDQVTVTLPEPKLQDAVIDPKTSRVVGRDRGLVDRVAGMFEDSPTGDQRYYVTAQEKLDRAAKHSDLVDRAEHNTTKMLKGLLGGLGYTNVTVVYAPPAPSGSATA